MPQEQARLLTKAVFALGVDEDALLVQKEEMEYEFKFITDEYIVLAQILLKLDLNLKKTRHELVPEVITEDDFWKNYFYKIECCKKDLGLKTRLGAMIPRAARAQKLE